MARKNITAWAVIAGAAALGCAGLLLTGRDGTRPLGRIRNNWPVAWRRRICGFPISEPAANQDFRRIGGTLICNAHVSQPTEQLPGATEWRSVASSPLLLEECPALLAETAIIVRGLPTPPTLRIRELAHAA